MGRMLDLINGEMLAASRGDAAPRAWRGRGFGRKPWRDDGIMAAGLAALAIAFCAGVVLSLISPLVGVLVCFVVRTAVGAPLVGLGVDGGRGWRSVGIGIHGRDRLCRLREARHQWVQRWMGRWAGDGGHDIEQMGKNLPQERQELIERQERLGCFLGKDLGPFPNWTGSRSADADQTWPTRRDFRHQQRA